MKNIIKQFSLLVATILIISAASIAANNATTGDLEADNYNNMETLALLWNIQIDGIALKDTVVDYVEIAEDTACNDGPPIDFGNDIQNPPNPAAPYLDMYLTDGLPGVHAALLRDCRFGPDTSKVFNLTVLYTDITGPSSSLVDLTWTPSDFLTTEYIYANLTDASFTVLADMTSVGSYQFTANTGTYNQFHIVLEGTTPGCEYQICVDDTLGDTWNGGLLDVYVNGAPVYTGLSATDTIAGTWECWPLTVETGDTILMDYTYGSWAYENTWKLVNSNGYDTYVMVGGSSDTTYDGTEIVDCDEMAPPVPEGADCTNPIVVDIPSDLTYTDLGQTNCGLGNSYSDTELGLYDGGEDIIYEIDVTSVTSITVTVESLDTWIGVALFDDCPDVGSIVDGGNAYDTGWTGDWTFNIEDLPIGTYYLMIDTFPSPTCVDFDLTIELYIPAAPQPGDDCTDPIIVDIPADLDYLSNNYTCGRGNDYSDTDLGSYDGGEDIIYRLDVTADVKVDIELDALGTTWTGIGLFDDCPDVTGTAVEFSTETGSDVHGIYDIWLYAVDSPYYIMIDTYPSPDCIPAFDLTITEVILVVDVGVAQIISPPVGMGNLLVEDFESGSLPTGWQIVDDDGDGYNWFFDYSYKSEHFDYKREIIKSLGKPAHSGVGQAVSESYYNPTYTPLFPDNWLITPQISIPSTGDIELIYWVTGQDPSYSAEHIEVWISTTGTTVPGDFTDEVDTYTCDTGTDVWQMRNVDLTSYAGQDIYMAFRHCDVTDMFILKLDDVSITYSNPPPEYYSGDMVPMQSIVENYGETTETFDVHAMVEDTTKAVIYDEVISVGPLAPGATYDTGTDFPDFDTTGHPGDLDVEFYTDLPGDANTDNDNKSGMIFVHEFAPPTAVLDQISYQATLSNDFTVEFDGSGSYDNDEFGASITQYDWNFGDGSGWQDDLGSMVTHTYYHSENDVLTYYPQLRVHDNEADTDTTSAMVTVSEHDDDPPIVQLENPRDGDEISGTVNIEWFAIDSEDGDSPSITLQYSGDGGSTWTQLASGLVNTIGVGDYKDRGEYSWNTNSLSDGNYFVKVLAFDSLMNSARDTNGPVILSNHNSGLLVSYIAFSEDYIKNGDTLEVYAGITHGQYLTAEEITADLTGLGYGENIPADSFDGITATWDIDDIECTPSDGPITITVTIDEVSNTKTVTADNTQPTINNITPENALYFLNAKLFKTNKPIIIGGITIKVDAYDETGIQQIEIYIDDELKQTITGGSDYYMNTRLMGRHTLKISAYDNTGNLNENTQIVTFFNPFGRP